MNADLKQKFKRLKITNLPSFDAIMDKYDKIGRNMSINAFYTNHVVPVEPSITEKQWRIFMGKLRAITLTHVETIMEKSKREALAMTQLEQNSLKNVYKIADITLQQILDSPSLLESIPLEKRTGWLFKAMAARDSRARTQIATRQEQREQSFFEKMMDGAQYGAIDAETVPTEEHESELGENLNKNGEYQEQPILDRLPAGHAGLAGGE